MATEQTVPQAVADRLVRTMSAELLLQELRSDVRLVVLDVRKRDDVGRAGTIPGARCFPLDQLLGRIAELSTDRSLPVVVVSQTGQARAYSAASELIAAGFPEVLVLDGGLDRWVELGCPVESRRRSGEANAST